MSKHDMHTSINGQPAEWTEAIWRLWYTFVDQGDPQLYDDPGLPSRANYFTARPYQDEWDQGDRKEGFTFVVGRHGRESNVYQVITNGLEAYRTAPQPRP
mgnify:CR=1 FL=1